MNLQQILTLVVGATEGLLSVFIKNPASQKVEAIVVGTVDSILSELGLLATPVSTQVSATSATVATAKFSDSPKKTYQL